jgi:hypothetical protein
MKARRYDIHGLVEIVVAADVRQEVIKEIDFQIGAFHVGAYEQSSVATRQIMVFPYAAASKYDACKGEGDAVFYHTRGRVGEFIRDDREKFFVARTDLGYVICADYANFLINLYIQLLLVEQGITMSHAAAYKASDGGITVLAGAGGIGKTAVLGYAVGERGLQHLGDDIILLDAKGICRAFPRQFVLKSYHKEIYADIFKKKQLPIWNAYVFKRFIIENAPFTGALKKFLKRSGWYYSIANLLRPQPFLATVSPDELFGKGTIVREGKVSRLIYLDRSFKPEFVSYSVDRRVLVNRLFSVIHYEWKDFLTHLVSLGALNVTDLARYMEQSIETFWEATANVEMIQIDIPVNASPQQLIEYLDKQGLF